MDGGVNMIYEVLQRKTSVLKIIMEDDF